MTVTAVKISIRIILPFEHTSKNIMTVTTVKAFIGIIRPFEPRGGNVMTVRLLTSQNLSWRET